MTIISIVLLLVGMGFVVQGAMCVAESPKMRRSILLIIAFSFAAGCDFAMLCGHIAAYGL